MRSEIKIIQKLIEAKADVNLKSTDGFTPLHYACKLGWIDLIRKLVNSQANLESQSEKGTPLLMAMLQDNSEVIELMVKDNRANLFAIDSQGNTCLHIACAQGNSSALSYILELENQEQKLKLVSVLNQAGNTCLHEAVLNKFSSMALFIANKIPSASSLTNKDGITYEQLEKKLKDNKEAQEKIAYAKKLEEKQRKKEQRKQKKEEEDRKWQEEEQKTKKNQTQKKPKKKKEDEQENNKKVFILLGSLAVIGIIVYYIIQLSINKGRSI